MARLARIIVPGIPHHVTARGNRREPIFFEDGDEAIYLDLLGEQLGKAGVAMWAYCLMPNHVHLIACPTTAEGMGVALGAAHRRWANFVNARGRWRGHLFDGRYASVAMDEDHLIAAIRYVALNPVRARLVATAQDWAWSSVHAHLAGADDGLVTVAPVLERVADFAALIATDPDDPAFAALRAAEARSTTGQRRLHCRPRTHAPPPHRPPRPRPKAQGAGGGTNGVALKHGEYCSCLPIS